MENDIYKNRNAMPVRNIVWRDKEGKVYVTHLAVREWVEEILHEETGEVLGGELRYKYVTTPEEEAARLQVQAEFQDREVAAFNIELPEDRILRAAWGWTTPKPEIDICPKKSRDIAKGAIRHHREKLFKENDAKLLQAIQNNDTAGIDAAKKEGNRLRDLTKPVDGLKKLEEIKAVVVEYSAQNVA